MTSKYANLHQSDTPETAHHPRSRAAGRLIGRAALLAVLGLAFAGYLTPEMRIQWANLMTLCGF